jgi:hypothetical protein
MLKGLRRLDVYPKTLEDFTEKTTTGAVVSLVTLTFVLWLFVSEVALFMSHEVDPQLFVDTERSDKIRINLDIYFPAMPCSFLTLDAMDSAGELQLDLAHNVFKRRHRNGVPLEAVRENVAQRGDAPRPAVNATAPGAVAVPAPAAAAVVPATPGCGSCYGAQTRAEQCCNTCEEVREAYRIRGWAFANPEGIAQCSDEGFVKGIEESKGEGCQVYGYLLVNKASTADAFHRNPNVFLSGCGKLSFFAGKVVSGGRGARARLRAVQAAVLQRFSSYQHALVWRSVPGCRESVGWRQQDTRCCDQ